MIVACSRAELALGLESLRAGGGRFGFVPTMGYLHEGHLSLLDVANERSDVVSASMFVNPLQFEPSEDLGSYPRDPDRDLALLEKRGVDLVFLPEVSEMYPSGDPGVMVDPWFHGESTVWCLPSRSLPWGAHRCGQAVRSDPTRGGDFRP